MKKRIETFEIVSENKLSKIVGGIIVNIWKCWEWQWGCLSQSSYGSKRWYDDYLHVWDWQKNSVKWWSWQTVNTRMVDLELQLMM